MARRGSGSGRGTRIWSTLRRGVRLVHAAAPRLLVATSILQVVSGLATVGAVVLGGRVAARMIQVRELGTDELTPSLLGFLVMTFVALATLLIKAELQRLLSERTMRYATDVVLRSSNHADLHEFENPEFHDLLVRALDSASRRPGQLTGALLAVISAGTTIVGLMIALVAIAPLLLLVVVAGAFPLLWTARQATRHTYTFNVAQTERDRRRNYFRTALSQRVSAAEIRLFGIGDELRRRVDELHTKRIHDLDVLARTRSVLSLVGVVVSVAVAGVVMFGLAQRFESGELDLDDATIAAAAFLVLSQRLQGFSSAVASVLECALFLGDIDRFTDRQSDRVLGEAPSIETIALDAVDFSYPAAERDVRAVSGVNLELRRGELVALVGENGSGKSTIARLLSMLYQPTNGALRVNGETVDADRAPTMRRRIAAVHQDYLQLLMTAADNIGIGDLDRIDDTERVLDAARFAQIDAALAALPQGFDTVLGTEFSRGQELSGGQWQRIAIARAWFRDADVLLLDEPTSALDPKAEVELIERARQLAADKVVVLISHRFGTVAKADRIVVMHEGRVVEEGSHADLMALDGVYASLYTIQAETFGS